MSPDAVETILADFRAWLLEARPVPAAEPVPALDIATVLSLAPTAITKHLFESRRILRRVVLRRLLH